MANPLGQFTTHNLIGQGPFYSSPFQRLYSPPQGGGGGGGGGGAVHSDNQPAKHNTNSDVMS